VLGEGGGPMRRGDGWSGAWSDIQSHPGSLHHADALRRPRGENIWLDDRARRR
jgi:hypothetical protein